MPEAMQPDALVIGGGPAGLMAADALVSEGHSVVLVDAKPSLARKLLMAGKSGLNLTKDEDFNSFLAAYGAAEPHLRPMLKAFGPDQVQDWARGLDQELFTGSTGRVFPKVMKASPLLRSWLARLAELGLRVQTGWRWTGWQGGDVRFETPGGLHVVRPKVTVLACGGASWARLGSDGSWAEHLRGADVPLTPFAPANFGLSLNWSDHMKPQFGAPLKGIRLTCGGQTSRGEIVLSERGLEGGGLYPLGPALRSGAPLSLDLVPDIAMDALITRLSRPRGKQSLANHLRKTLRLGKPTLALLQECAHPLPQDPKALAGTLKALEIPQTVPRPLDEAISTAGGVPFSALDGTLMLKNRPGTYCAGEMLDWEAPTGGYLLTACLATGLWAGRHAAADLRPKP